MNDAIDLGRIKERAHVGGYSGVGEMIHRHNTKVLGKCSGCYIVGQEILDHLQVDALIDEIERLRAAVRVSPEGTE